MGKLIQNKVSARITTKPWIVRFTYPQEFENIPTSELPSICGEKFDRAPTDLLTGDIYLAYGARWRIVGREIAGKPGESHRKNKLPVAIALYLEQV